MDIPPSSCNKFIDDMFDEMLSKKRPNKIMAGIEKGKTLITPRIAPLFKLMALPNAKIEFRIIFTKKIPRKAIM